MAIVAVSIIKSLENCVMETHNQVETGSRSRKIERSIRRYKIGVVAIS